MAVGNRNACVDVTLKYEGGFSDNRKDPGNWTGGKVGLGELRGTKYGIAASSHPHLDIASLTLDDARRIYGMEYWSPVRGDELPFGLDMVTFDYGVNSGISRASKALQTVVKVPVDGRIGSATLAAVNAGDVKSLIQKLCAQRLAFLKQIKTWATFKGGWSARVANVEAVGVSMWLKASGAGDVRGKLEAEAKKADATANTQGGVAGGGAAAGGGASAIPSDLNWWLVAGVAAVALAVIAVLLVKSHQNKQRAQAYRLAAGGA